MSRLKNEIRNVYGRLTVVARAPNVGTKTAWVCICSCSGKSVIVLGTSLRSGNTQSCGCYNRDMVRETWLGRSHTNESKDRMSKSRTGKYKGKNCPNYNEELTDEERRINNTRTSRARHKKWVIHDILSWWGERERRACSVWKSRDYMG